MLDVIALFYRKYGRFWVRMVEYNILVKNSVLITID